MKSSQIHMRRVVLLIFYWLVLVATCPERCICKWKNGKQNVECIGKNYNAIPENIDQGSQVLDFSENNLVILKNNTFELLGLINLQKIYLVQCKLNKIYDMSFQGLKNLVELDLSQNLLTTIPSPIFADCSSLMRLLLNENPIKVIQKHAFKHLSFLTTLEISNSDINFVEDEAFIGLNNLEWLKLDSNKIANIKGTNILPESLHGIDIHNNKWQCDCHLRDLYTWMSTYNTPQLNEPLCYNPKRYYGKPIKSLNEIDLACLIDVFPSKLYVEINEGQNISLQCIVNAIPEANISWWYEGQNLLGDSLTLQGIQSYRIDEEGTFKKKSELLIFNANEEINGTYECVGENPAGKSQANYTIKVLTKEEPLVVEVEFPFEYMIALITGGVTIILIIIILISISVLKYRRNVKMNGVKKRVQNSSDTSAKNNFASCLSITPGKINSNLFSSDPTSHVLFCQVSANHELSPNNIENNFYLPGSNANFNLDNNPDLINHADNKDKCKSCVQDCQNNMCPHTLVNFDSSSLQMIPNINHRQVTWIDQQNCANNAGAYTQSYTNSSQLQIDIHNKTYHDNDGYPLDYGLPKIDTIQRSLMLPKGNSVFYRTLPHKSTLKKIGTPRSSFSNEAEMYVGPKQSMSYNIHNPLDKRYTMEGYPFVQPKCQMNIDLSNVSKISNYDFITNEQTFGFSHNHGYQDTNTYITTNDLKPCGNQCTNCNPKANFDPSIKTIENNLKCHQIMTRCIPTQTEPESEIHTDKKGDGKFYGTIKKTGISIESADEGYVGDGQELKDS